jgi:hypothetical protein
MESQPLQKDKRYKKVPSWLESEAARLCDELMSRFSWWAFNWEVVGTVFIGFSLAHQNNKKSVGSLLGKAESKKIKQKIV